MKLRPIAMRATTVAAVALLVFTFSWAADQAGGILQPQMKPTKGTYKEPAGEIGKKAKNVWSTTTIASSVDGKPVPGKAVEMVGEIVDLSCYLQVGKHGDKHRECGQKCIRHGQPVGLLLEDGTCILLIDEEHDPRRDGLTEFRQSAIEHMAHIVTIRGTATSVGGQKAIYVQGFVKSK